MTGKVVMVTGASSGVGKATARMLARMGAHVVMVCREGAKATAALKEVTKGIAADQVEMLLADLASQNSIRELAAKFKETHDRLDVLINNAGMIFPDREVTFEGLERTFALNHMAYFMLTDLLCDILKASAPARIVNVASEAHRMAPGIGFDDLRWERKKYGAMRAYAQSKLANILLTYELARRLEGTRVTANCLHPGFVRTGLYRDARGLTKLAMGLMRWTVMIPPEKGALTPVYLATSPQVEEVSGRYFIKSRPASSSAATHDAAAGRRLWEVSTKLIIEVPS